VGPAPFIPTVHHPFLQMDAQPRRPGPLVLSCWQHCSKRCKRCAGPTRLNALPPRVQAPATDRFWLRCPLCLPPGARRGCGWDCRERRLARALLWTLGHCDLHARLRRHLLQAYSACSTYKGAVRFCGCHGIADRQRNALQGDGGVRARHHRHPRRHHHLQPGTVAADPDHCNCCQIHGGQQCWQQQQQ